MLRRPRPSYSARMSPAEVKKLRGDWSDQIAIKFGESASVVIDSFTESLKQGFGQEAAKRITEGAMESAAALELNIADLMKLAGKTATGLYGNVKNADPARVVKMMNSVAVAAAATAADPDEVIEANKRALSVLSTTKMRETDLSAFTSVAISAGLQPNKAGTALGYLTSEFANAGNARGQRATDLNQASQMLGYGNRQQMAQRMASAPTEFMLDMFTKMQSMSEQNRAKFANLAGMREWRDELVQMAKAADQIRETLKEIDLKGDSVSAFSATKLKSLQKRWDRIKVMFSLAWERLGSGFENTFVEISNWFDKHSSLFTSGRIAEKSREFVEKLKKAFGIGSTDEALSKIVEKLSSIDVDRIIGFASGFVGGLVSVANSMTAMLKSAANIMGRDGNHAEVLGKLSGQIVGLSVALGLLAPVLTVLAGFAGLISRIAGSLGGRALIGAGARLGLGPVLGPAVGLALGNEIGVAESAIKRPGETTTQWRERQRKLRELRNYQTPSDADPLFEPSSYTGSTGFSGRRRSKIDDLAEQLNKFGANVQRAAFINSAPGGALQFAAMGGSGRGLSGLGRSGGGLGSGLIGNVPDMLRSKPGSFFSPDANLGSIIRRDKIPSFGGVGPGGIPSSLNRSAFERTFAGTPLAGKYDQIVASARRAGVSPALLASVMAQETGRGQHMRGNNPGGLMGRNGLMQFGDLDSGIDRTALAVAKNYNAAGGDLAKIRDSYAPLGAKNDPGGLNGSWLPGVQRFMGEMGAGSQMASNSAAAIASGVTPGLADRLGLRGKANFMHGQYGGVGQNLATITLASGKRLTVNAAAAESFKGFVDELEGSGYKISSIGGYSMRGKRKGGGWSQHAYGNAIDINPGKNAQDDTGRTDMPANIRDMAAKYGLSWGGDWSRKYNDPMHFEWNGMQPWKNVPAPADAIRNVPSPIRGDASLGVPRGGVGGAGGLVSININGTSHDPEALATLVQRRIDESMNWRTHDMTSEYT
ncbi:TP901 family phage tail tape measure protein [Bradyrhizobium liaoningense]